MKFVIKPLNTLVIIWIGLALFIASCADVPPKPSKPPETPGLVRLELSEHPLFKDDIAYSGLIQGIRASLSYLKKVPPKRVFRFGKDRFNATHMIRSLIHFEAIAQKKPSAVLLNDIIRSHYLVYQSQNDEDERSAFFTGYYEPQLRGRRQADKEYKYPVYRRPGIWISLIFPYSRMNSRAKKYMAAIRPTALSPILIGKRLKTTRPLKTGRNRWRGSKTAWPCFFSIFKAPDVSSWTPAM